MKKQLLAALLITAFSGAALAQTVATVNGTKIDSTEVDAQVQMLSRESQGQVQDSPELRQSITKRLITRTLMIQEAKRLKIDQSPQYKAALDEAMAEAKKLGDDKKPGFKQDWATFQDNLLTRAFLAAVVGSHPHVTQGADMVLGKPVIWSLGNLVFDGFELPAAKIGWLLRMAVDKRGIRSWNTVAVRMDADGTPTPDPATRTPCGRRGGKLQLAC